MLSKSAAAVLPRSGVIQVDERLCLTCRECEVACSLAHEQACQPSLSRILIDFDDFLPGFPILHVCKQCDWPACYYACAARNGESVITIAAATGARYVDQSQCLGCGACARACPLTPERQVLRFRLVNHKRIYFKCDLCWDRAQGPLCVEACPAGALTFAPAKETKLR